MRWGVNKFALFFLVAVNPSTWPVDTNNTAHSSRTVS